MAADCYGLAISLATAGAATPQADRIDAASVEPERETRLGRVPNLKPRWDVHLLGVGNRDGSLAEAFRLSFTTPPFLLIASAHFTLVLV